MTITPATIIYIGMGVMGAPMAGYLARAGHQIHVYNRSAAKSTAWCEQYNGASIVDLSDIADLNPKIVMACVGNDDDARECAITAFKGMPAGSVYVDHTTTSATLARELAGIAKSAGLFYLDAPVSGGQAGAENGQLTIMVGGDNDPVQIATPFMETYAKSIVHIGPSGHGQTAKMVNQIAIAGVVQGLAEAVHFAKNANLDTDKTLAAISNGAAQSWQMDNRWQTMAESKFNFGFSINWMRKDLNIALEEARTNKSQLPLTALVDQFYAELQAQGDGGIDTSGLVKRLKTNH